MSSGLRSAAERSPRKIFVTEHDRRPAGAREPALLSLHITKTLLSKHRSPYPLLH